MPKLRYDEKGELINRYGFPILPHLDPKFNPDHPVNHQPKIEDDPYLPLGKRNRQRLEAEALEKALESYSPPHVLRSWEVDTKRNEQRQRILSLTLPPKMGSNIDDLLGHRPPEALDFRQMAATRLHLGYNRFHAFGTLPDEDDPTVPPEDICWIMEYTENECNTIRRKLAHAIGEFPAVTDKETSAYNYELAFRYERRLYARCRRRNKRCIRPSHIEIFTSSFDVLP